MKKLTATLTAFLVLTAVTINFGFDSSILDNRASQSLDIIAGQLKSFADYTIHLSGHTDNIGSDNYNDKLSHKRVTAVKNYLIAKGVDSTKIKSDSYGERKPTVPNTSDSNRALNRRVEVTISGQQNNITPPQTTSSGQTSKDSIISQKQDSVVILPHEKEVKKKKKRKRLVWTGWKTGFHWDTAGDN